MFNFESLAMPVSQLAVPTNKTDYSDQIVSHMD